MFLIKKPDLLDITGSKLVTFILLVGEFNGGLQCGDKFYLTKDAMINYLQVLGANLTITNAVLLIRP